MENISILVTTFRPRGIRDFLLLRRRDAQALDTVHPLELLKHERIVSVIQGVGAQNPTLARRIALCRLLVPCLNYRGSDRHIVLEGCSIADLQGESLSAGVRTQLARELAGEQALEFEAVTNGIQAPSGSLAELFWASQTDLPALPDEFEDEELGRLADALYFHLVPEGTGVVEIDWLHIERVVNACRKGNFADLNLGIPPRKLHRAFRRLLAVTARYAGQLTGDMAEGIVFRWLRDNGQPPLSAAEKELLALRYGACRALNDLNLGFLFGCSRILADLVNNYFLSLVGLLTENDHAEAEKLLRLYLHLVCQFQRRRKHARAHERRETRQRHAPKLPAPRVPVENVEDTEVPPPDADAIREEEMELFQQLLPLLKERDRLRLQTLLDCHGDRKQAAAKLGIKPAAFSQQLRQTVLPAARELARQKGLRLDEAPPD
jgi:hypothetical protein